MFVGNQIAVPETCPADTGAECSISDGWEGEFFPGISKIKYEVKLTHDPNFYIVRG